MIRLSDIDPVVCLVSADPFDPDDALLVVHRNYEPV